MQEITEAILHQVIQPRPVRSHKGTFGRAVLIGGNQQYGGAIIMSAEACIQSGAGLTTVITHRDNHSPLHSRLPEAMTVDWQDYATMETVLENADVLLIGPGLGTDPISEKLLRLTLSKHSENQWLIIDGSAITLFSHLRPTLPFPQQTIFTPHEMEWQRLSGIAIADQQTDTDQQAQQRLDAIIIRKSHRTVIYSNEAPRINTAGNPGMATGGTGDTLAGIIAGFLAQFPKTIDTITAAVFLHSYIGDQLAKESYVVLPTRISESLPFYMNRFLSAKI